MNILSIGNSFSQDAQKYLHKIAACDKFNMRTFNLMIPGCPLSVHYKNTLIDQDAYWLEINGENTGFKVSLKEGLLSNDWDVITIQQVSHKSPYYESYQPYLDKVTELVRLCAPKAKIALHQTWAYEQGSKRLNSELGYTEQADMFKDIEAATQKASKDINADMIIPSGELFQKLISSGITKIHRDTFHASLGVGRYALGLLWYAYLTGNDIKNNTFKDFDEEVSSEEIEIVKQCVKDILK